MNLREQFSLLFLIDKHKGYTTAFLIIFIAYLSVGCTSGSINMPIAEQVKDRRGYFSSKRVALISVPTNQSNIYQEDLERELQHILTESQMFAQVVSVENKPEAFDIFIQVQPAKLTYSFYLYPAYVPLALATFTLYIWVGGPLLQCSQDYEITLNVRTPDGKVNFDVSVKENVNHYVTLYSDENAEDPLNFCRKGPNSLGVIDQLLTSLNRKLLNAYGINN